MVSNFYWVDLHHRTCVASDDRLWWEIDRNRVESRTYVDLVRISEVNVCWFISWIHTSFLLCSFLSVVYSIAFEDAVQSFLNTCLHGVCSLVLTEPHAAYIYIYRCPINKSGRITPAYLKPKIVHKNGHPKARVMTRLDYVLKIWHHSRFQLVTIKWLMWSPDTKDCLHFDNL